jgi:hypothetical protein
LGVASRGGGFRRAETSNPLAQIDSIALLSTRG